MLRVEAAADSESGLPSFSLPLENLKVHSQRCIKSCLQKRGSFHHRLGMSHGDVMLDNSMNADALRGDHDNCQQASCQRTMFN